MRPNQLEQRTADDVIADAPAVVRREYAVCEINSMLKVTICAAALGDIASFEGIYECTESWLLRRVRRITGAQDAEDVLADVYLQVWRSLPEYDDQRGEPLAWLATIARSRALDRLRTERRSHGGHPQAVGSAEDKESENAGPEELLATAERHLQVKMLLDALSRKEQLVVRMAYFGDCSQNEIAKVTGLPLGSVKSVMRRAQQKLRLCIEAGSAERGGLLMAAVCRRVRQFDLAKLGSVPFYDDAGRACARP